MPREETQKSVFWADQIAEEILTRKKFKFIDKEIKKPDVFVVKTSASISGVLHIGRLSDSVRGEAVFRALKDKGVEAKMIWVAEDMDPLRKVPKGVPKEYEEYIGMPVSDIPDPWGCHDSYEEHHLSEYMKVLDKFIGADMEIFYMREEYKKGSFNPFIKKALEKIDLIKQILNKYRTTPLPEGWSPWVPVCEKCGKIITPRVLGIENGKIHYVCQDYKFEKYTAKGCGHEGYADPLKGNGKLMWKSEWAAQWARWGVVSEGAGKEYQVPSSAFWVNAEIVERVFDYPMPVPIFYEHIMIDGEKMSASLGNVVYPKDWLEVARPEILRYLYCKKLMKTRSFSWKNLPKLYDEFDNVAKIYYGLEKVENEKELAHLKRLYEMSQVREILPYVPLPYSHAVVVSQVFKRIEDMLQSLQRTGHYKEEVKDLIIERLRHAKTWAEKYCPEARIKIRERADFEGIDEKTKEALIEFSKYLSGLDEKFDENEVFNKIKEICEEFGIQPKEFFKSFYKAVLGKDRGPRITTMLMALTPKKVAKIFEE